MRGLFLLVPLTFLLSIAVTGFARAAAPVSEQRPVADFTRVDFGGQGDLTIFAGETSTVTVDAEPRILEKITTEVRDGTLYIRVRFDILDWWRSLGAGQPHYSVSMKRVEGIDLSGSGLIQATGLNVDDLDLALGGSGQVLLSGLTARSIHADLSGSGRYQLSGRADEQTFRLAGSGQYEARELRTTSSTVQILGSGDVHVWATDSLTAEILGSGSIRYSGEPRVTQKILGSGSIRSE